MAVAATAAVVLAVPSIAAAAPLATIQVSKHKDGPFKDDQIKDNLSVGEVHDYYFKATNNTDDPQQLTLNSFSSTTPQYKKTWFKGDKNITSLVTGGGYGLTLKQKPKLFRAHVKKKDTGSATCLDGQLYQGMSFIDFAAVAIDAESACV